MGFLVVNLNTYVDNLKVNFLYEYLTNHLK